MIYLLAAGAGLAAAIAGWFITGIATVWIAGLAGMSDFEGARATFAFFAIGPLGGLVAAVLAVRLVLRRGQGPASPAPRLRRVALVLGIVVSGVAAGFVTRMLMVDTYTNEVPPALEFEVRVPARMPVPDPGAVRVELHTDRNVGESALADPWSRLEDDHRIIAGTVPLAYKTRSRLLAVTLTGQSTRLFTLSLARDPASTPSLGAWQRATHVDVPGGERPAATAADDPFELRWRVRRAGEE